MQEKKPFMERLKADPLTHLIALFAIVAGLLFFAMQTSKLFRPEAAEAEMRHLPFGLFDWGYVWSDTIVAGPALFLGGILLLWGGARSLRLGQILTFAGFALNLYAIIFFTIGLRAVGEPLAGSELWFNVIITILGLASMVYLAYRNVIGGHPSASGLREV